MPLDMIRKLMARGMFCSCRLLNTWTVLVVDGTVQEKCRKGFEEDGKTMRNGSDKSARYRYVLQAGILGPNGMLLPFMHESMDMHNLKTDKEDCEIEAFVRLAASIKEAFPRMSFCLVGDALYACERIVGICENNGWRHVLTLKEGRQPTLWNEMLELLAFAPQNHAMTTRAPDGKKPEHRDFRWVEDLMLGGQYRCNAILEGACSPQASSLYAWITNFRQLNERHVIAISNAAGRERHSIEDHFNAQKNRSPLGRLHAQRSIHMTDSFHSVRNSQALLGAPKSAKIHEGRGKCEGNSVTSLVFRSGIPRPLGEDACAASRTSICFPARNLLRVLHVLRGFICSL